MLFVVAEHHKQCFKAILQHMFNNNSAGPKTLRYISVPYILESPQTFKAHPEFEIRITLTGLSEEVTL